MTARVTISLDPFEAALMGWKLRDFSFSLHYNLNEKKAHSGKKHSFSMN